METKFTGETAGEKPTQKLWGGGGRGSEGGVRGCGGWGGVGGVGGVGGEGGAVIGTKTVSPCGPSDPSVSCSHIPTQKPPLSRHPKQFDIEPRPGVAGRAELPPQWGAWDMFGQNHS